MSVLVDTSVWVHHFRQGEPALAELLREDRVLVHPWVIGEIACGTPPDRERTLSRLALLRAAPQATLGEILGFIERERLHGNGCGLLDIGLLSSVRMTPGARLWTRDRRLAELAARFDLLWQPSTVRR